MEPETLEAAIQRVGSEVELLRNSPNRPYIFPAIPEFSNWRTEQRAWRETCALLDLSHHMTDLYLEGPDALRLLTDLGANSFKTFKVDKAKQFIACNSDGNFIGDGILFYLDEDRFNLVNGVPTVLDWVQFNLETGGYDAKATRDDNSLVRQGPPAIYRYEVQGPNAEALMERVTGTAVPEIKFFNMGSFTIAGRKVRALRHGMAGQPGYELFGPWEEEPAIRAALLEAGKHVGLVPVGARAYSTANLESGWIPSPVPAIYSGDAMRPYREWLHVNAMGSLGGSFDSPDISDYYLTPYDLGYGRVVAFDHDFVGRGALEKIAQSPRRTKVTLVWDSDDVARAVGSLFDDETSAKYIEMPKARYALFQADKVLIGSEIVGISLDCGYIANEKRMVSLASVDREHSEPGTAVTVIWGENPKSAKPQVEVHKQVEIRATVAPAPYVAFARDQYRSSQSLHSRC